MITGTSTKEEHEAYEAKRQKEKAERRAKLMAEMEADELMHPRSKDFVPLKFEAGIDLNVKPSKLMPVFMMPRKFNPPPAKGPDPDAGAAQGAKIIAPADLAQGAKIIAPADQAQGTGAPRVENPAAPADLAQGEGAAQAAAPAAGAGRGRGARAAAAPAAGARKKKRAREDPAPDAGAGLPVAKILGMELVPDQGLLPGLPPVLVHATLVATEDPLAADGNAILAQVLSSPDQNPSTPALTMLANVAAHDPPSNEFLSFADLGLNTQPPEIQGGSQATDGAADQEDPDGSGHLLTDDPDDLEGSGIIPAGAEEAPKALEYFMDMMTGPNKAAPDTFAKGLILVSGTSIKDCGIKMGDRFRPDPYTTQRDSLLPEDMTFRTETNTTITRAGIEPEEFKTSVLDATIAPMFLEDLQNRYQDPKDKEDDPLFLKRVQTPAYLAQLPVILKLVPKGGWGINIFTLGKDGSLQCDKTNVTQCRQRQIKKFDAKNIVNVLVWKDDTEWLYARLHKIDNSA